MLMCDSYIKVTYHASNIILADNRSTDRSSTYVVAYSIVVYSGSECSCFARQNTVLDISSHKLGVSRNECSRRILVMIKRIRRVGFTLGLFLVRKLLIRFQDFLISSRAGFHVGCRSVRVEQQKAARDIGIPVTVQKPVQHIMAQSSLTMHV